MYENRRIEFLDIRILTNLTHVFPVIDRSCATRLERVRHFKNKFTRRYYEVIENLKREENEDKNKK